MIKKIIERKELNYKCNKCKHNFIGTKDDIQCASCDSFDIKLIEGERE
ncbi:hypothetical protein LCGC14_3126770 [marine sediment metagenome]|uniref:Uncharacterized protein n=1 Tax=marine sediment metagenome TaxID=412755 RepID=A0A0F8W0W8_9ZZZZ